VSSVLARWLDMSQCEAFSGRAELQGPPLRLVCGGWQHVVVVAHQICSC
jgi:hypothetical protein